MNQSLCPCGLYSTKKKVSMEPVWHLTLLSKSTWNKNKNQISINVLKKQAKNKS